jgi:hypothetical protein
MIRAATGAALGAISAGAGAIGAAALRANKRIADKTKAQKRDKAKVQKKMMGGMTAGSQSALGRIQKARMMNKGGGADLKKDPTKPVNPFLKRRMKLAGAEASKAKKVGKFLPRRLKLVGTLLGAAAAGIAGKKALEKRKKKKELEGDMEGAIAPYRVGKKKVDKKKMGGLKSELNNPARGYTKGGIARGGGAAIKGTDFKGVF